MLRCTQPFNLSGHPAIALPCGTTPEGLPTSLQLVELARPDHPLLRFILRNAPGTYQHSLQVANLAECKVLRRAWAEGQQVDIHGWVYDVKDGRLRDIVVQLERDGDTRALIGAAEAAIRARYVSG